MPAARVTEDYAAASHDVVQDGTAAVRVFSILAESLPDAHRVLRRFKGIEKGAIWRDAHGESDPAVRVKTVGMRTKQGNPLGGEGEFTATVKYGPSTGGDGDAADGRPRPGGPPVYSVRAALKSGSATLDRYGEPILNLAGQPLRLPFQEADYLLSVDWFRRGNPSMAGLYATVGSTNARDFRGIPAGFGLCIEMGTDPIADAPGNAVFGPTRFTKMRASFLASKLPANPNPINQGLQEQMAKAEGNQPAPLGANGSLGEAALEPQPLVNDNGLVRFARPGETPERLATVELYEPRDWGGEWGI